MTELAPDILAALAPLAREQRLGVISDIDGTLSQIAPTPAAARLCRNCRVYLRRLVDTTPLVAVCSGRAVGDAWTLVGVPDLLYVGNHGLERLRGGEVVPDPRALAYAPSLAAALAELKQHPLPEGVLIENKGVTGSIHYRLTEDEAAAAALLAPLLQRISEAHGLRLLPGRMIFELRPPLDINKGTAVFDLIDEFDLRAVIVLGDDVTDVDAFRALRAAGERGVATLSVGILSDETPMVVRETCDVTADGVAGTSAILAWLADQRETFKHTPEVRSAHVP
ncbi:MAG TPA: trehalose-phosphatase [Herpetosiphonaceae bacterium]